MPLDCGSLKDTHYISIQNTPLDRIAVPEMPLTEMDIHSLGVEAGWSAERPRLTTEQMEGLFELVKHPFAEDKRDRAYDWLNGIYASSVAQVRGRAAVTPGPLAGPPIKISTAVNRELTKLAQTIDRAIEQLEGGEIATYAVVHNYLRHIGGYSDTHLRLEETLRRSWRNGFNALLSFEVACDRHEETRVPLSTYLPVELEHLAGSLDEVIDVMEGLCTATWDVLEHSFEILSTRSELSGQPDSKGLDPQENILAWLSMLKSVASHCTIKVKPGRDEAPLKAMIEASANLFRWLTDQEPRRVYQPGLKSSGAPAQEAGDFLTLVQGIAAIANERLRTEGIRVSTSLSYIVRVVLEERKVERPT